MKKLFLCLLMLLCCAAVTVAEDTEVETYTDGIYEYTLTDEGAVLTDCDWSFYDDEQPDTIELPSTLGGYPVVGIGHLALCTDMYMDADYDFTLIIPEGIMWLSDDTFWCCHNANVIHFPASLTNIPEGCFDHVWATFVVAEDNPRYEVRNGFLIDVQTDTIIYTEVNCGDNPIPAVRRIGAGSMDNWGTEWGQDMVIPEGVEEIGEYAFYDWELSRVTLPESLRLIESHAFNVGIIEPVILPAGVEMVQRWAFSGYGRDIESNIEVIATSDATHFETADEYEARTGYRHWMDDEDEQAEPETHTDGIYEYTLTDEGAVLTRWKWYTDGYVLPEVVELPAELDGQPVVGIGYNALNTSQMDYEDTFTLIVPEGVKWLDEVAFQCCHNADVIYIPASLTEIPEACFHHVGAEMIVAESNPRYTVQSGYLIDTQTDTLIYCQPSTCGTALPAVRRIGKSSLDNWHSWEMDAIFPAGVQEIGAYALQDTLLASLTLPDGLLLIEEEAICGEIIQPVTIPASVQLIQRGNFTEPGNTIILMNDATHFETADEYEARTGYRHWLDDEDEQAEPETHTDGIYEYTLTDEGAVLTDCDWSFYDDEQPDTIELPSTLGGYPVVGIGDSALCTYTYMDADYDFTLILPEGVKWLSDDTFWCCHNANVIHFPASLTNIPEGCFDHVWATFVVAEDNLRYEVRDGFLIDVQTDTIIYTEVNCGDNPIPAVRRIGAGSMDNWGTEWGQDMVIPEGVEEIGEYAFYDWEFSRVTLPESLRLIESNAFDIVITEPVILPAGVEMVQRWAFSGCGSEVEVIATSDATHFETADEYEARTGYRHWMDDWAEE